MPPGSYKRLLSIPQIEGCCGVVQHYHDLTEWERKVRENRRPAEKERYVPPKKKSARYQLRRLQAEDREQNQGKKPMTENDNNTAVFLRCIHKNAP